MNSKIVKRYRDGEKIPAGAKYLKTEKEHDHANIRYEWRQTDGIMGILPIFGTETYYRITPVATFHYYELES